MGQKSVGIGLTTFLAVAALAMLTTMRPRSSMRRPPVQEILVKSCFGVEGQFLRKLRPPISHHFARDLAGIANRLGAGLNDFMSPLA
jgi:hypothetical protein